MELTKEIAQMICDLEYRIGACCYNPHSTDGYTGEIGRTFRFPVTVYDEEKEHVEHKTRNNYRYYISNPEDVKKLTYLVGANHFHIGVGLIRVLRYLESEYKINFNELEDERQKRIQKEEAQREKLEKVLEDCFKYAESLHEYGGEYDYYEPDDPEWEPPVPEKELRETGDNRLLQKLFFEKGLSVETSITLLEEFGATEKELMRCDPMILQYYPGYAADEYGYSSFLPVLHFSYFMKAYDYFVKHLDPREYEQAFEYYINCVADGFPIHSALEAAWDEGYVNPKELLDDPSSWFDPRELIIEQEYMETYDYLEAMAEEQQKWNNVHIDEDLWIDPEDDNGDNGYM